MFSNVGINPFGPGGASVNSQPQSASPPTDPGKESQGAARGESAASGARPETMVRVDPMRQSDRSRKIPSQDRKELSNPDAPTGPPPTFEETPLERQARLAFLPPDPKPARDASSTVALAAEDAEQPHQTDQQTQLRDKAGAGWMAGVSRHQDAENAFAEARQASRSAEQTEVDLAR